MKARRVSVHLDEQDVRRLERLRRRQNATTLSGVLNDVIAQGPQIVPTDMGIAGGIDVSFSFTGESLERLAELQDHLGANRSAVARGIIRQAAAAVATGA